MSELKSRKIVVKPPGPKSQEIIKRTQNCVFLPIATRKYTPIVFEESQGPFVKDADGNVFIDFANGFTVMVVGHCHPEVVEAARQELGKLLHVGAHEAHYELYTKMAEELVRLASLQDATSQLKKSYLCNSGSEAIDGIIRISKTFTKRPGIVAFSGSFHGLNAIGGMSVLGSKSTFKVGSRPLLPEVSFMPYAYCYRCPFGLNYPECNIACANYFEYMLDHATHPQDIALVLMEPIQGEGGYIVPPKEFVQKIKKLCEKHQILFGADEVQTGFAKTGKMFAVEHFDVKPDLVALAKTLGGGLPLGAILGRDDVMSVAMALSGTFGGNPVSCAAGLATLNIIQREKLADRATRLGEKVMKRLLDMKEEHKFIGDVRGKGLLIGIEIVKNKETKAIGAEECFEIRRRMWEKGVITLAAGLNYHVVRFAPALNIPEEVLDDGVNVFEEALTEFEREFPGVSLKPKV